MVFSVLLGCNFFKSAWHDLTVIGLAYRRKLNPEPTAVQYDADFGFNNCVKYFGEMLC